MSRVLGIPAVLVVALLGIYLYAQDAKTNGPTSTSGRQAISQAQSAVAATNFSQAAAAMQASYAQNGTYAGATLPVGSGVTLVSADAYSYCLQAGNQHEVGPTGSLGRVPASATSRRSQDQSRVVDSAVSPWRCATFHSPSSRR